MQRRSLFALVFLVTLGLLSALPPRAARAKATPTGVTPPAAPPAATAPATPPAPPSPVSGVSNKISATDLFTAETIQEVHRENLGDDAQWLAGLGWLARGALLVGDTAKSRRYAADLRLACAQRLTDRPPLDRNRVVVCVLGARSTLHTLETASATL